MSSSAVLSGDNFNQRSATCSPQMRYIVSVCVLTSVGFATLLLHPIGQIWILSMPFGIFITGFIFQWVQLYSSSLTRHKRAFFDEANILDTYQPRARTHGHLFQPDPPTPVPGSEADRKQSKSEFERMRDEHYNNMFTNAEKAEKEKLTPEFVKYEEPVVVEFKEPPETDDEGDDEI
ncbi:unnamed protein product [Bursaphelenchus xylophilus]|uniref:(pine wood nematode) hypothetical protein n=1 Tax=Bursaphelenchus xylophilus TaxID=6326 RepID=A0A1I7RH79_BURXY|nr:unnamed protein product [Bursaphelenchus xylophilus]CAG9115945.1 unnamed protein product [Bursaphelenchus xylophilus]